MALEKAGCQLVRVAVPDMDAAQAIGEIKKNTHSYCGRYDGIYCV